MIISGAEIVVPGGLLVMVRLKNLAHIATDRERVADSHRNACLLFTPRLSSPLTFAMMSASASRWLSEFSSRSG
jgi:hypothetical protein